MAEDRVITLRFREGNSMDMELYRQLENEKKELGLSMPIYVKGILRRHFQSIQNECDRAPSDLCFRGLQELMREEFASLEAVLMRTLARLSGNGFSSVPEAVYQDSIPEKENALPEYSNELPEGMDSVLDQFL